MCPYEDRAWPANRGLGWRAHINTPARLTVKYLGGSVPSDPENPYPISDQNTLFSIPYFRPDSKNVYTISDPAKVW